ncbi:TolC family protein [Ningiella sp. W23]|uniref:TolC family protein n=1 Tax=Ningiella sp. W23 TaxID=3023715 RepID=UPI0037565623
MFKFSILACVVCFSVALVSAMAMCAPAWSKEQSITDAANEDVITLEQVLKRTLKHHPRVSQAMSRVEQSLAQRLIVDSSFDWQLNQSSTARTSGFYNGWIIDQSISRILPFANGRVSGGYRLSDGSFPIYEDINRTLSGGEAYLNMRWSLLQNRDVDDNRVALENAELSINIAQHQQELVINALLLEAANHFLRWKLIRERRDIIQRLVDLAQARNRAIEQKVAGGELARITLTEFEVTMLSRQADLLEMNQALEQASIGLAMFYRDDNGMPMEFGQTQAASLHMSESLKRLPSQSDILSSLSMHPELIALENEILQTKNVIRLSRNQLMPTLDLKVDFANDIGAGAQSLEGFESYVGLDFSLPIGQREAKGKIQSNEAKLDELNMKRQEMLDVFTIEIKQALAALNNLMKLRDLRDKQAQVALRLMQEEKARFDAGDSDLFLLNSRETDFSIAQLAAVDAQISLLQQHISILASAAMLDEAVL